MGWSSMNAKRRPYANKWAKRWDIAYRKVGYDYLSGIKKRGYEAIDYDINTKLLEETYRLMFLDIGVHFALYGSRILKPQKSLGDKSTKWIEEVERYLMEEGALLISSITQTATDTMLKIVRGITKNGIDLGLGIEDIAENIAEQFASEWGDASKWMGRRVAQTETIRASNYGVKVGIESLGIPFVKSWLFGPNARPSHQQAGADNDRIPQDQPFIVGGYNCEYPGDPSLPPEESINCRCSWTAEPID